MTSGYNYTFPAMRGIQACHEYFVAMCPLKLLPKLFLFDGNELPAELRAQRTLNYARIPEMARYILSNPSDYAFSAITVSIDGPIEFRPASIGGKESDVGEIIIPMTAKFVVNDGQHRRAAIEVALQEKPDLGEETIAVVFYLDAGLRRCQQLFADLNKHAIRPTKSIGVLYDNRDPLACLSRDLAENVRVFRGFTEMEKTTISNRSIKLFTLSGIYDATGALLSKKKNSPIKEDECKLALEFWNELSMVIPEWKMASKHQVSAYELRREYVHVHNVVLESLGILGNSLITEFPWDWKSRVDGLGKLDWRRSNPMWQQRTMLAGTMSKSKRAIQLTAILLKQKLGLTLTEADKITESRYTTSNYELERSK